jgi:hypothetical protein
LRSLPGRFLALIGRLARQDSRADLFGVGVVKVLEDGERFPSDCARGHEVGSGVVGVAEVAECCCFAVAKFPGDAEGLLAAGDGLGVLAEVMVGGDT